MSQKMVQDNRRSTVQSRPAVNVYASVSGTLSPSVAAILRKRRADTLPQEEPPQVEMCLSPLLWSESLGYLMDG